MTNYLSKDKRIFKDLSKNAKRDYIILLALTIVLFVVCAFAFFEFMYFICNILGSFVCKSPYQGLEHIKTTLPLLVGYAGEIYVITVLVRLLFGNKNTNKNKLLFKSGIAMLAIGLFVMVYFIVGSATGIYKNVISMDINHRATYVDKIVMSILYPLFGGAALFASFKLKDFCAELPLDEVEHKKGIRVLRGFGSVALIMASAFSLAALYYATYTVDLTHNIDYVNSATFYIITVVLMYLACLAMVVVYFLIYLPLKKEHKLKFQLVAASVITGINLVIFILYEVAHGIFPNAANVSCYAIMPIEFSATVNVFGKIYGIINLAAPVVALILAIIKTKKVEQK